MVLCKGTKIGNKDLYIESDSISVKSIDIDPVLSLKNAVNDFKRGYITKVLEKHGWKQTKASETLKIQRTYLSRLINELNISKI